MGHPGKNATQLQKKSYSNHMVELDQKNQESIDFIFLMVDFGLLVV